MNDERAISFGDGVFETCYCNYGRVEFFNAHYRRFALGLKTIFAPPIVDDDLAQKIRQSVAKDFCGRVKWVGFKGGQSTGYSLKNPKTHIRVFHHQTDFITKPVKVFFKHWVLPPCGQLAKIKHTNRLQQVIFKSQQPTGFDEVLLDDYDGNLCEAISANFFAFNKHHQVWTPKITHTGVLGVMRQVLIDIFLELGFEVFEVSKPAEFYFQKDFFCLSNSLSVRLISQINQKPIQPFEDWFKIIDLLQKKRNEKTFYL